MVSLSQILFDGNRRSTEALTDACDENAVIGINLGAFYSIHFVIIFAGYGELHLKLILFELELTKISKIKWLSSE